MTLKWSIDQSRGRLEFGKLIPMAGGTYAIQVSGQVAGATYTFYVMDEDATHCLARSACASGAYSISFDQEELRRNFEKVWHEVRTFHVVASDGTNTVAEGDLAILWNPVWTVPSTGAAYSMKGPKGDPGESAGFATPVATAVTLEAGSQATAAVEATGPATSKRFAFSFGIPRGPQGYKGDTGDAAGFDTPTAAAERLAEHASPTAAVEATGPATSKRFAFSFGIPAGVMPKPSVGTVAEETSRGTQSVVIRRGTQGTEFPVLDFRLKVGKSAYDVAVDNGYTGTEEEWLSSLVGGDYLGMQATVASAVATSARMVHLAVLHRRKIAALDHIGQQIGFETNDFGEKIVVAR